MTTPTAAPVNAPADSPSSPKLGNAWDVASRMNARLARAEELLRLALHRMASQRQAVTGRSALETEIAQFLTE